MVDVEDFLPYSPNISRWDSTTPPASCPWTDRHVGTDLTEVLLGVAKLNLSILREHFLAQNLPVGEDRWERREWSHSWRYMWKNAHLHVPIQPSSYRYMWLAIEPMKVYYLRVLPFSHNTAPLIFTLIVESIFWIHETHFQSPCEVCGTRPVTGPDSCKYRLNCLHLQVWALDVHIKFGDIENWSVGLVWFRDQKHAGVKCCMV